MPREILLVLVLWFVFLSLFFYLRRRNQRLSARERELRKIEYEIWVRSDTCSARLFCFIRWVGILSVAAGACVSSYQLREEIKAYRKANRAEIRANAEINDEVENDIK